MRPSPKGSIWVSCRSKKTLGLPRNPERPKSKETEVQIELRSKRGLGLCVLALALLSQGVGDRNAGHPVGVGVGSQGGAFEFLVSLGGFDAVLGSFALQGTDGHGGWFRCELKGIPLVG